ncbi:MAG TPA: hypothetical protein VLJ38_05870 [Polyangiaceae bacterium]|nr:hypothetical protein [Polyangiaceae bacterium]
MPLDKLTTLLVVEAIEPCLPAWEALGYAVAVRVPEAGTLGFVILKSKLGELMLQTKRSLAEDLPDVAARGPSYLLYADVSSLTEARKTLPAATVIVPCRKTFYGATEAWLDLAGNVILGLAEHD